MTTQSELGQEKQFVGAILPWLVAAAALVIYLLTLNHWVSIDSLFPVAKATGQYWAPELSGPLFYLVTYPFRWLPATWVPLALNLFTVLCAALVLALLARSVALLPHDRTHQQRQREHSDLSLLSTPTAWIPPVLAAAVCGLQLSFWESATSASNNMFDLLLFAYVIRCLLEYRIVEQDSWLFRAALVYGAAMTNNWLMVGLFPVFIAALVWIRGFSFFDLRFLRGMFLCGLAGLLLYLLLPVIYVMSQNAAAGFWPALKYQLVVQKNVLRNVIQSPTHDLLLLAMTSFLPILLIAIRWSSYYGDPSKLGIALTTWILHLAHAALLAACVWVAFDPVFSPRQKGFPIPALYYLAALSVGYFSGYFLLVFQPLPDRLQRVSTGQTAMHRISLAAVWALLLLVPAGLAWKNAPQILMTNGPVTRDFAARLTQNLPARCVVLSDDSTKLFLAEAWLAREHKATNYLFVDTQSLSTPAYHGFLQQRYPNDWPALIDPRRPDRLSDLGVLAVLSRVGQKLPLYYLHPSFGFYFEYFYAEPHGLVAELKAYPTNVLSRPALTGVEIAENETFWKQTQPALQQLLRDIRPPAPGSSKSLGERLMAALQIPDEPNGTASLIAHYYSQGLDFWGVLLQRNGHVKAAGQCFADAAALNPDSVAARANLECNRALQAGSPLAVHTGQPFEERFGKYRTWQDALRKEGPFDDPTLCYGLADIFQQGRLYRQAVQLFERVHQLVPDYLPGSFKLAQLYVVNHRPEKALDLLARIRARPDALVDAGIRSLDLMQTEAAAYFVANKAPQAEQILDTAMARNPGDTNLLAMVVQISTMFKQYTNALTAVERQLQAKPDDVDALINLGYVNLQLGKYHEAIPPLTRALTLKTNNTTALLDRAIAYLGCNQLDEARQDYLLLEKVFPRAFQVYYGLGEIAWRKKDTNAAIHYYELYMTNSIPGSAEAKTISERLDSLKAGSR